MSRNNVLSLALDVSPTWLVVSHSAADDLDNLIVNKKSTPFVRAEFLLESLFMEGVCYASLEEFGMAIPAAGVELGLYDGAGELVSDARVLRNHAYFQLAGNPGMYFIRLLKDGGLG